MQKNRKHSLFDAIFPYQVRRDCSVPLSPAFQLCLVTQGCDNSPRVEDHGVSHQHSRALLLLNKSFSLSHSSYSGELHDYLWVSTVLSSIDQCCCSCIGATRNPKATKMIKGLEQLKHPLYKDRLRILEVQPREERVQGDLIKV